MKTKCMKVKKLNYCMNCMNFFEENTDSDIDELIDLIGNLHR